MFPCFDEVVPTMPDHDRYPTLGELELGLDLRELDALSRVGPFANMLAAEPEQKDVLADLRARAKAKVRERALQLASAGGLEPVPIRSLVQCQLASMERGSRAGDGPAGDT